MITNVFLAFRLSKIRDMKFRKECGFDFVKIGEAYLSDRPLRRRNGGYVIFDGKELKDWRLKLRLVVDEKILDAEQSVYLVLKNNEILYVGCYSNSLRSRWWKKQGYFWYGEILDNKVNELVENNNISV